MPYTTLVAGTTVTASWANASVRDQVVTPFASSAARTSAIASPVTGMVTYQTDTSQLEMYTGAAWEPAHARIRAYKVSNQTLTSSSTLQDDTELAWALRPGTHAIDLHITYNSTATADFQIKWSVPAGATMAWSLIGVDTSLTQIITANYDATSVRTLGGNSTALTAHAFGTITVVTAGTLRLQWAQNVSEATVTTMYGASSYGIVTRLV